MNIVVTGSAGFFGNYVTNYLLDKGHKVIGIDNLSRKGSELNAKKQLQNESIRFFKADVSVKEDLEFLNEEHFDWIIDCAADPSVLSGFGDSSRKLLDNNLISTINLLEICKRKEAGFILMSTSRVYSIADLCSIPYEETMTRFKIEESGTVDEEFSIRPPLSLYGSSKMTSEVLAIEYSQMFNISVWINRCGVIAGPGQFGKIDQGVFSFWIYSWLRKSSVKYIGFEGSGKQVRDVIHPIDICDVMNRQIQDRIVEPWPVYNLGGGIENSASLLELSQWCSNNINSYDKHVSSSKEIRPFDIPVFIMNTERAKRRWDFKVTKSVDDILTEIRDFAIENPGFIEYLHK
jgi:CDP-paratose 2-epimerase